jgi:hypothetical protein
MHGAKGKRQDDSTVLSIHTDRQAKRSREERIHWKQGEFVHERERERENDHEQEDLLVGDMFNRTEYKMGRHHAQWRSGFD